MSDYSFMKSGFNNVSEKKLTYSDEDLENIEILLSVFITNAITNASKYIRFCKRNGITQEDILYGLRYEVFEFLNNKNLMDDIKEATEDYNNYKNELDYEDDESLIVPDDEIDNFKRIEYEHINEDNHEFIEKIHLHFDNWNSWNPSDNFEKILKNAIDKVNL